MMKKILIVGGASLDILHFKGQTTHSPGGAGMYTAMAARRNGMGWLDVGIFAPKPDPMPEPLQPVAERISWDGPIVPPDQIPRFEYEHNETGTIVHDAFFGAELTLNPDQLPADLSDFAAVHVIPLGDAHVQLSFVRACRERGAKFISAGCYVNDFENKPEAPTAVFQESDALFLNEKEANIFFGSLNDVKTDPGKLVYVTLGDKGALVVQGDWQTHLKCNPVQALDPTGAGDTFCGGTLANLVRGEHPVEAAGLAMPLAAEMVQKPGPTSLIVDAAAPLPKRSSRVRLDYPQIEKVAQQIATLEEVKPHDFMGPDQPALNDPNALDYFFALTLQQFSFWTIKDGHYHKPLIAPIAGKVLKGSAYISNAYFRALQQNRPFLTVEGQAHCSAEELNDVLRSDEGKDEMPAVHLHHQLANSYGRDMLALGESPQSILEKANASSTPLATFLQILDGIGGYKEDPLRKKSTLLALILNQRPEQYLHIGADEAVPPVIDYHLMRSSLRTGIIEIVDEDLIAAVMARRVIKISDEEPIRQAAFDAFNEIVRISGKSMGAVDFYFFGARSRCPEMSEPQCELCSLDAICAKRKELFQPVVRTTFY